MQIEVNGKEYEVKINIGFVRELDKIYNIKENGFTMGMGVTLGYSALDMYSISDLTTILRLALPGKHTQTAVDNAIEQYAEDNDGLEGLFEGLKEALRNSSVTTATVEKFQNNLETQEEE